MIKKIITISFAIFFFLAISISAFFYYGFYFSKDNLSEEKFFIINTGDGLSTIGKNLEKEGIIKKDYFFLIYGVITEKGKSLKPGNYVLRSNMSISEIMDKLSQGDGEKITIIEGWNLRDIALFLEKNGYGTKEEFYEIAGKPPFYKDGIVKSQESRDVSFDFEFLEDLPLDLPLEGYIFPDTYFISQGTPMDDIVYSFLSNFDRKINEEIRKEIEKNEMSFFEIITIASLIEKEVIDYNEKKIVSGIIQKRMKEGMRLQLDATITYLTGRRSVSIPLKETRIDSPYNTYVYSGLPKGPICNPGIESIKAALRPKKSDYFYYLSKPNGETVFSETHKEHVDAKNKYLR